MGAPKAMTLGQIIERLQGLLDNGQSFGYVGNRTGVESAVTSLRALLASMPSVSEGRDAETFEQGLADLLNRHSMENGSNTPDFMLADFLRACLRALDEAIAARDRWYGVALRPGASAVPASPPVPSGWVSVESVRQLLMDDLGATGEQADRFVSLLPASPPVPGEGAEHESRQWAEQIRDALFSVKDSDNEKARIAFRAVLNLERSLAARSAASSAGQERDATRAPDPWLAMVIDALAAAHGVGGEAPAHAIDAALPVLRLYASRDSSAPSPAIPDPFEQVRREVEALRPRAIDAAFDGLPGDPHPDKYMAGFEHFRDAVLSLLRRAQDEATEAKS